MLSELDKIYNPCYRGLFFLPAPKPLGAGKPFWERPVGGAGNPCVPTGQLAAFGAEGA
jgi:hypothetical protein